FRQAFKLFVQSLILRLVRPAEAVELLFRLPVIQREKAKISSNILYQLRPDVACGAVEETSPRSFRPVLRHKLTFPVFPYIKLPDNHVLAFTGQLSCPAPWR